MPRTVRRYSLTLSQKQEIERMYYGPYDTEWRDDKGQVINSDKAISERTGLHIQFIVVFLNELIKLRNETGKPVFLEYDKKYPKYVIVTLESKVDGKETEETEEIEEVI